MAWYEEAVFYHIYPLGLTGAPMQNDYGEVQHRLRTLEPWIGHIRDLGCNAVYIGPLFESVGHGYETTDYRLLDRRLGDNGDLKQFVLRCHEQGLRVIFDGVFNHTGRDFFAFRDLREKRENSRYRDWYCNVNFWGNNEYNDGFSYQNWGGYDLLARLNQKNPEVRDYIADVVRFWVREFDVDGIRLDAADVLDFEFMQMLRSVAREVKPDFWLMGEVIHGDYSRWVNEGTLHSVTNYQLHKALYSGHNEHNYFEIAHTVRRLNQMGELRLYNFTDNHDVERITSKLSCREHFLPVHILLYTLPGIPSIYYGSEFGIEGRKERYSDASLRPALDLNMFADAMQNNPCTKLIRALGHLRQNTPVLSYGDYREVLLTNRQYGFTRSFGGMTVIVAVNNDDNACSLNLQSLPDGNYTGALYGIHLEVRGGTARTELPANAGEIWLPEGASAPETIFDLRQLAEQSAREKRKREEEAARRAGEEALRKEKRQQELRDRTGNRETVCGSASEKYGLSREYAHIDPDEIARRTDYNNMEIRELQVAILEKMAKNGPVNEQMIRTVMENVYPNSLQNWVRSFH